MKARCAVLFAAVFLLAGVLGVSAQDEGSLADIVEGFSWIPAVTGASDVIMLFRASDDFQAEWPTMTWAERHDFPLSIYEIDGTLYVGEWFSQMAECPKTVELALTHAMIVYEAISLDSTGVNTFAMLFDTSPQRRRHNGFWKAKALYGCL